MELVRLIESVVYIELPAEPRLRKALAAINERVLKDCNFDLIIDFNFVEVLSSIGISNLITLQNLLKSAGYKLVLCNVKVITKCIFDVAGIDKLFTFADNKDSALALLTQNSK
jgi:anti-anti-sigma factor